MDQEKKQFSSQMQELILQKENMENRLMQEMDRIKSQVISIDKYSSWKLT